MLVIVGVAVGLLSGMFGIGGGTVIVPALIIGLAAAVTDGCNRSGRICGDARRIAAIGNGNAKTAKISR